MALQIHLLAVSLLTAEQLTAYDKYATDCRQLQRHLLLQLCQMSTEAQKELGKVGNTEPEEQYEV